MALALRAAATPSNSSASIATPAGLATGDLVFESTYGFFAATFAAMPAGGLSNMAAAVADPAGWNLNIGYKAAAGTETSFDATYAGGNCAVLFALTGGDTTTPFEGYLRSDITNNATFTAPAVTPTKDGCWHVVVFANGDSVTTVTTPPAGYTLLGNPNTGSGTQAVYYKNLGAGSSGVSTGTKALVWSANGWGSAASFLIRPAAASAPRKRGYYGYLAQFALSMIVSAIVSPWPSVNLSKATYPGGPTPDPATGQPIFAAADRPGGANIPTAKYWYLDLKNGNDAWDGTAGAFVSGTTGPKKTGQGALNLVVAARGDWLMVEASNPFRDGLGSLTGNHGGTAAHPTVISTYVAATWASHTGDRTGRAQQGWDGTNGPTAPLLNALSFFVNSQYVVIEHQLFYNAQNLVVDGPNLNSFGEVILSSRSDNATTSWIFHDVGFIGCLVALQGDYAADVSDFSSGVFTNGSAVVTGVTTYPAGNVPVVGVSGNAAVNGHGVSLAGPINNVPSGTTIVSGAGSGTLVLSAPFSGTSGTYPFCTNLPTYFVKDVIFSRHVFAYGFTTSGHIQGLYLHAAKNCVFEDGVGHHNGWQGTNRNYAFANTQQQPQVFNHDFYFSGENQNIIFRRNFVACGSLTGAQIRCGGVIEGNVFGDNPTGLNVGRADNYQYAMPFGIAADIKLNVISRSGDMRSGVPQGYGLTVGNLTTGALVYSGDFLVSGGQQAYNIICDLGGGSTDNIFPFSNAASVDQPSSVNYHDNIQANWGNGSSNGGVGNSLASYLTNGQGGPFYAQWLGSLTNNLSDVPITAVTASGANVSASGNSTSFGGLLDTTRSIATYATSLGYASISAMGDAAMLNPYTDWALNCGNWVRAGFNH